MKVVSLLEFTSVLLYAVLFPSSSLYQKHWSYRYGAKTALLFSRLLMGGDYKQRSSEHPESVPPVRPRHTWTDGYLMILLQGSGVINHQSLYLTETAIIADNGEAGNAESIRLLRCRDYVDDARLFITNYRINHSRSRTPYVYVRLNWRLYVVEVYYNWQILFSLYLFLIYLWRQCPVK